MNRQTGLRMGISGIGGMATYALSALQATQGISASARTPGVQEVSGPRSQGGGQFAQAVQQALAQTGVNVSASSSSSSATKAESGGDGDGSAQSLTSQDLQQFMHDLIAALNQAVSGSLNGSDSEGSSAGKISAEYGGSSVSSGLDILLQQLDASSASSASGNSSSGSNALSALQNDFAKLVSDVQAASSSGAGNNSATSGTDSGQSSATLQAFLQNLASTPGYQATGAAAVGSMISTVAA